MPAEGEHFAILGYDAEGKARYRCRRGHEQVGQFKWGWREADEMKADSGPTCFRCFCEWMGQRFPTQEIG